MEEKLFSNGEIREAIKGLFDANGVGNYLVLWQGKKDQAVILGKGERAEIELLLAVTMFRDERLMDMVTKALQMANAEKVRDN